MTNNHVVAAGDSYEMVFSDGDRQRAELVGSDVDSDLAVLKVDQLPDGVDPVSLAGPDVEVGQRVVAIGNPFGEQGTMSLGIISGIGRSLPSQRQSYAGSTVLAARGDPDRCADQPRQLRRAAAKPGRASHRHQRGDREHEGRGFRGWVRHPGRCRQACSAQPDGERCVGLLVYGCHLRR